MTIAVDLGRKATKQTNKTFDNSMFSCIVFCDVSKAFDRVWHKGLLFKLRRETFRVV